MLCMGKGKAMIAPSFDLFSFIQTLNKDLAAATKGRERSLGFLLVTDTPSGDAWVERGTKRDAARHGVSYFRDGKEAELYARLFIAEVDAAKEEASGAPFAHRFMAADGVRSVREELAAYSPPVDL